MFRKVMKMNIPPAFVSGMCAAFASAFGKLSGLDYLFLDYRLAYLLKLLLFCIMVLLNSVMWTFFVRALHSSKSSLEATVMSSGTNYITSGILGFFIFQEATGLLYWTGISFILIGIILINPKNHVDENHTD